MIGSVYRIIHLHSNICYVGSTLDSVRNRWQGHKNHYKDYLKNDKDRSVSIYPYFKQYGIDTFKCVLVKEYEVEDKNHLFAYEQLWINKFKPINMISAFNPLYYNKQYKSYKAKEYYQDNKDKSKKYYQNNKDKILQAKKEYVEVNKDKIKQYYDDNKDKIKQQQKEYKKTDKAKQQQKEYRDANKDKIKQYYQANKDKLKQQRKAYRETNKDKINQYDRELRSRKKQLNEQLEADLEYEV